MTATNKEKAMDQNREPSQTSTQRRFSLRAKITVGNMALTFAVILVMGIFIFFRIEESSKQLVLRLEENVRSQSEEALTITSREQAQLLSSIFENISSNTSIIGSSITDILDERTTLLNSGYWDAQTSLQQLESGSWDNVNTETASIFIPAGVPLTDSFTQKLNLLKHSELVFPSILEDNPDIIAIYFGGTSKETIYYPNIDLANIVPADFDVTGRQWYVSANPQNNPNGNIVWSAPYEDAALNGLVITASIPVNNEQGQFQGVAAMDVQLNSITDQVNAIEAGDTGYAFLVDRDNRVIALPASGFIDFEITDENALLGGIIDTAALSEVSPGLIEVLDNIAQDDRGLFNISLNDSEKYIAYQVIPEIEYKLVIIVPSSELLASTNEISDQIVSERNSTILTSLALIIGIFTIATAIAYFFSNNLTAPLQSLSRVASEITKGNFNAKANIKSGDEIEALGDTLNTMTDTVKELVSSLEERVHERTSELQTEIKNREGRSKQYEAIARVAQEINTQKNLKELLPRVTEVISQQFGFYHVGIFLNDAREKYAVLAAANSEGGNRMLKRGHQLKIGTQGIVGTVAGTGKPRIALRVGEDAVYFNNPDLPTTQSEMALPLIEAGVLLGVLDVQSTEADAFSNDDLETLTILAELVSIAIQNAKLYEQMERSLTEAEAASKQYFRENWKRLAEITSISGYRYAAGSASRITDAEEANSELAEGKDRKQILVPIVIRGQEVGELSVQIPKEENIKADQMDLIRAVAERVAVIAENARLFDETSRRAQRERMVTDITTKIRETNDPQVMIETAIKELREALNVSRVEIVPQKNISPDR